MRNAIFGLFHLAYRIAKRCGPFTDLGPDAMTATLVGGTVASAYHSPRSAQEMMHAIAAPIRTSEEVTMKESTFFALASGTSTDRVANKHDLVYTRMVPMGKCRTAFLGLQDLHDASAVGILAAYKQVMLRAGLTVEEWISSVFWYCADGAVVMQPTENGVAGLLMQLQRDLVKYSVIVPLHANCHRADLAFRDAMDSSHEFPDVVATQ